MTYAQLGNLRISTIYYLNIKGNSDKNDEAFLPGDILERGLHLDARCSDGEHWYAIAKISYDDDEDTYDFESVGPRLMDALTADNLEDAKYLINYAYKLMRKEWAKRHPDED